MVGGKLTAVSTVDVLLAGLPSVEEVVTLAVLVKLPGASGRTVTVMLTLAFADMEPSVAVSVLPEGLTEPRELVGEHHAVSGKGAAISHDHRVSDRLAQRHKGKRPGVEDGQISAGQHGELAAEAHMTRAVIGPQIHVRGGCEGGDGAVPHP